MSGEKQIHHPVPNVQDGDPWDSQQLPKSSWTKALRAVADNITAIKGHHKPKSVTFHKAGEKPNTQLYAKSVLLTSATD